MFYVIISFSFSLTIPAPCRNPSHSSEYYTASHIKIKGPTGQKWRLSHQGMFAEAVIVFTMTSDTVGVAQGA